jgi:hypothetical protein
VRKFKMMADEHPLTFQKIVMTIKVEEDEHHAHSQDEVDSVNIKTERLPMILTEETVGQQQYMEAPVEMGRRRKICIVASEATVQKEKKVPVNKTVVGLEQPTNLKATKAKVVPQSSPYHRPSPSNVNIYKKKVGYSKIKAKVDTWKKM